MLAKTRTSDTTLLYKMNQIVHRLLKLLVMAMQCTIYFQSQHLWLCYFSLEES